MSEVSGPLRRFNGLGVMRCPSGMIHMPDGTEKPCQDFARQWLRDFDMAGGTLMILPNTKDEHGEFVWDFKLIVEDPDRPIVVDRVPTPLPPA